MADLQDPLHGNKQLIAASTVTGTNVYDLSGEKLGSVYDVMLNKASGRTEYVLMNFGGLFGIGERYHPLPWHVLRYDAAQGGYVVDLDRRRLEAAPSYQSAEVSRWSDDGWGRSVDDYYGAPTHDDLVTGAGLGSGAPLGTRVPPVL